MSVYKSDKPDYLREAIESILNQSIANDLYLYRDGIVTASLQKILDEYATSGKIKYYSRDKNEGLASSLNYLIDIVVNKNYDYIARMDSDDISHPNRLERQLEYFNSHKHIDICGTFCREFGASYALQQKILPTSHEKLIKFSIARCPFIHPSVMFRAKIFDLGHRYPTNTQLTEDMAFWFELLKYQFKFGNINEVLIDYRVTEDTVTRRQGMNKAWSEFSIRLKHMFILRQVSISNFLLVSSRLFFHILPSPVIKLAYKFIR
ncbi:glycosyltransferase [Providencia rettgeri]|nr:glycosyltransferase [Proteus mirabilis]HEM8303430.1 glycosyltransferase [Providencia stuartii]